MKTITNVCYLTPNNFQHKAGDGTSTRKRNISYIHPALQANCGATQCTYLLVRITYENKVITIGNYMQSNYDASRIVDKGEIAPCVKENHGTVTAIVEKVDGIGKDKTSN